MREDKGANGAYQNRTQHDYWEDGILSLTDVSICHLSTHTVVYCRGAGESSFYFIFRYSC